MRTEKYLFFIPFIKLLVVSNPTRELYELKLNYAIIQVPS